VINNPKIAVKYIHFLKTFTTRLSDDVSFELLANEICLTALKFKPRPENVEIIFIVDINKLRIPIPDGPSNIATIFDLIKEIITCITCIPPNKLIDRNIFLSSSLSLFINTYTIYFVPSGPNAF
jgi:hypothetical protein